MGIREVLSKENASVGIFGLGRSNDGVIEYLRKLNPRIRLTLRSDCIIDEKYKTIAKRVLCESDALSDIDEDVLFLSPSVRRDRQEIAEAKNRGMLISSDAELFFELTDKLPIAVTGSDGKSTTTHLIAKAHTLSGRIAEPCGNYGRALTTLLDTDIFPVAELSSFQLSYFTPSTSYAVITNITPNHLNWHRSLHEYISAKMNVTKNAEKIIFDADGEIVCKSLAGREVFAKTSLEKDHAALKKIGGASIFVTHKNGIIYVNGSPYIDTTSAKRREVYNLRNYMLTVASCLESCDSNAIQKAITSFEGLSHRAEEFFTANSVRFIDSSIDSSPERTLKTLSALKEKPIVIIGGLGKGLSLEQLAKELPHLTRGAVLMSSVGRELFEILSNEQKGYRFTYTENLTEATRLAYDMANGRGTVILSPAATSFDFYKNFSERGNAFKNAVYSLFTK